MKKRMIRLMTVVSVLFLVGVFYQQHVRASWNTIAGLDSEIVVTGGNGFGSSNTIVRRFTTVVLDVGSGITYTDDPAYGASFLINAPGVYAISYSDQRTDNAYPGFLYYIEVDHSPVQSSISTIQSGTTFATVGTSTPSIVGKNNVTLLLDAGDVVRPYWWGNVGGTYNDVEAQFIITRVR
jgi:hypothetical protein